MARMFDIAVRAALVTRWSALSIVTAGYATGAQPVQVTRHATDPFVGHERIVVDATDGTLEIDSQRAGTKTTRHEFDLTVFVAVVIPGWTSDQIETRRGALVEALLEDLLTQDGVVLSSVVPGLAWCRPHGQVRTYVELVGTGGQTVPGHIAELTLNCMGRG